MGVNAPLPPLILEGELVTFVGAIAGMGISEMFCTGKEGVKS